MGEIVFLSFKRFLLRQFSLENAVAFPMFSNFTIFTGISQGYFFEMLKKYVPQNILDCAASLLLSSRFTTD